MMQHRPGKLSLLHESFIDLANRPMDLGSLPVKAQEPVPIIVPIDKWTMLKDPKRLVKEFRFRRGEDRVRFVCDMMEYEEQVQHHGELAVSEGKVTVSVWTKNIDVITERDKEYATYADSTYKDIVYSP